MASPPIDIPPSSKPPSLPRGKKADVCNRIIQRLCDINHEAVHSPGFADSIRAHFLRLPAKYAQDVNVDRAEDVLTHKRLLESAEKRKHRPAFSVRAVHVFPSSIEDLSPNIESVLGTETQLIPRPKRLYSPPAFGSSPNLEALALERSESVDFDKENNENGQSPGRFVYVPMHEVTLSTIDKPKLLSELSSLLADIGLNIREAYIFSTVDGFSLDVFVVDGWPTEDTADLQQALETAIASMEESYYESVSPVSSPSELTTNSEALDFESLKLLSDETNDWEIDYNQLILNHKVASGSFGDLYRGIYGGRNVAIKILKPERLNKDLQKEFTQELHILRKVRHKNIVQFIGACTRPPNLCIITEFMSGGSVYDYLQRQRGLLKISTLLRIAIDISEGMDYLHENKIIHRDLKAANLLMDENEVVKIADFGVARDQAHTGIMTAETGTYRWMAPEVIEHKPYDQKADVYSFGIVLWELLTGKLPYSFLTPLQAAVAVVQKGLRPTIPKNTHPKLAELLERCWKQDPNQRPEFSEIMVILHDIWREVGDDEKKEIKGFFSVFKKLH